MRPPSVAMLWCVLAMACAPVPPPLAEVIVAPRSPAAAKPWRACVVSGSGDPAGWSQFEVFQDATGGSVVALVLQPNAAPAELSEFVPVPSKPGPGPARRALARFEKRGIRLSGWIDLDKRSFTLRTRVDILGEHLRAEHGTFVRLWGAVDGERVLASAPSPFDEPSRVAFAVPCELVEYGHARVASPPPPPRARGNRAHLAPGRIDLYAAADGAAVFSAVVRDFLAVEVLGRELGRVHIVAGRDPKDDQDGTLLAQGWVPARSLGKPPDASVDRSSGSIPDTNDVCPNSIIAQATDILLGSPRGLAIATLEAGASIDIVERQGEFVAIELQSGIFGPPRGARWWIHASAINPGCTPIGEDGIDLDGCPRCPSR